MRGCLMMLRGVYKWIYHRISGTCQLQRLALVDDFPRIEMSIRCSKQLRRIIPNILNKDYNTQIFEELCAIKQIPEGQTKQKLKEALTKVTNIYKFVNQVEVIIFTKYDSTNADHQRKLIQIWNNLKPNELLADRLSQQWIDIGFQDKDPATDFRGAGIMGLENLNKYSTTVEGKKTFQTASSQETQFFFASASLYMTLLTYHLIRERRFDKLLYDFKGSALQLYQNVYENVFTNFHEFWKKCPDKSMMSTNTNLQAFAKGLREKTPDQLIWSLGFGDPN